MNESILGLVTNTCVSVLCQHTRLGQGIRTGALRKDWHERPWRVPANYTLTFQIGPHCRMELLAPTAPNGRVILHLHGGGYVGKMTNSYRKFALRYSKLSGGAAVLSPDYRVAPAHPFPAALKDAVAAYDWLLKRGYGPKDIVVAGESAGGGLTLALCLYMADKKRELPAGLVLMSPWTDLTLSGASQRLNYKKDAVFGNTAQSMLFYREYLDGKNPRHPYISPVFGSFEGFPPMLIQVGSSEMLYSDAARVAQKAKAAGTKVRFSVYDGMFHLFQLAGNGLPESRRAWQEVQAFLQRV